VLKIPPLFRLLLPILNGCLFRLVLLLLPKLKFRFPGFMVLFVLGKILFCF